MWQLQPIQRLAKIRSQTASDTRIQEEESYESEKNCHLKSIPVKLAFNNNKYIFKGIFFPFYTYNKKFTNNAFAGSRTRVYCLEGNYPNR